MALGRGCYDAASASLRRSYSIASPRVPCVLCGEAFSKRNSREAAMTIHRAFQILLAAIFLVGAAPARSELKSEWVEYTHGNVKLKAYMAYDDKVSGRRPAILMIHAREGMTPKTRHLAESWAKLGYVTFAADIFGYGEGVLPK